MSNNDALNRSEIENSNLRKHVLWMAQFLNAQQRVELAARFAAPAKDGGVVGDLDANEREYEIQRNTAIEALTDHIDIAIQGGADDNWIAKADVLANRLREYAVSSQTLTFHELLNPPQAQPL